jgi:biotin carboxyl carrier protein
LKNNFKVSLNGKDYSIASDNGSLSLNNQLFDGHIVPIGNGAYHLLYQNKSISIDVITVNKEEKSIKLKINNQIYLAVVKDKYDLLLDEMGFNNNSATAAATIKAPMPGLVLKVNVAVDQKINKGDALLVLEAMKMENVIKAPTDGMIKKINTTQGDKVEKNQVMITLEK